MKDVLTTKDELIEIFCTFLTSIGIEVLEENFEEKTFLPGLKINSGKLILNRKKLLHPGDILHEAGHIAVTIATERMNLNDNVIAGQPDKAGEEMAVLLWTYAACVYLKADPAIVFHEYGYKGASGWLLENYANKNFIGLPLLVWMEMTEPDIQNGFPKMKKWLRD
jgi:hypothetical protein